VIAPLQCSLEGEERLVTTVPGTLVARLCGEAPFVGFHWCNYGVEPAYLDRLVAAGMVVSATAADAGIEALELPGHPFYVATLFQPQVGSSESGTLHPLIAALVRAAGPPS
jgi:CTP synthase (UTP-ammonia lyase)